MSATSGSVSSYSNRDDDDDDDDDDFPQPIAKRRRTSDDGDDKPNPSSIFDAPSRITKRTVASTSSRPTPVSITKSTSKTATVSSSIPSTSPLVTTDTSFSSLGVAPWIVHSLRAMQIHNPTEIQASCIPAILQGRDVIGGSRTGTGKTVAFAVPILQRWSIDPSGIFAVVLTATRELALQIYEQFLALGASQSIKIVLVTGGTEMRPQAIALEKRPHIVVATPGRLADHIRSSGAETIAGLKRTKVVVFDEADRLLSAGARMLPDIKECLGVMPPQAKRQALLFTATVTSEVEALKNQPRPEGKERVFVSQVSTDREIPDVDVGMSDVTGDEKSGDNVNHMSDGADGPVPGQPRSQARSLLPPTLRQTYLQVPMAQKDAFLFVLLTTVPSIAAQQSIVVFVNRTQTADILHRTLHILSTTSSSEDTIRKRGKGGKANPDEYTSLHSSLPQSTRSRNLTSFRSHKSRVLIATDVAGRGLDIPDVGVVINYDIPRNPVDYVHRVGRTARAGRKGLSISFVGQRDVNLVLEIEKYVGGGRKMVDWEAYTNGTLETGEGGHDKKDADEHDDKSGRKATDDVMDQDGPDEDEEEEREFGGDGKVNIETRVCRGRTLKDVGEARMQALREMEYGKDVKGYRMKMRKKR